MILDVDTTQHTKKRPLIICLHPSLFVITNQQGSVVAVSPAVQHRLGHLFPEPDTFDPDRCAHADIHTYLHTYACTSDTRTRTKEENTNTTDPHQPILQSPKPNQSNPNSFAPPREEHRPLFAYAPFGGGLHACLGQQFAFVQLKTVLSVLFSTFELELATPGGVFPPINYHAMVVGPTAPCTVKYRRRKPVNV